jgi:hypothetical protein
MVSIISKGKLYKSTGAYPTKQNEKKKIKEQKWQGW